MKSEGRGAEGDGRANGISLAEHLGESDDEQYVMGIGSNSHDGITTLAQAVNRSIAAC